MTIYVGGIRDRFIKDSVFDYLQDKLGALGWFDAGREHTPITFVDEPADTREEIAPNTLAFSTDNKVPTDVELGGQLAEHTWSMWVDFYAEGDAISVHLIEDVAAILGGRINAIGAGRPFIPVFDYSQATPSQIFTVEVDRVRTDKAHDFPHAYLRHWRACSFDIIDAYGSDLDGGRVRTWDDLAGKTWDDLAGKTFDEELA
jgi:hypothetical protein